jgi:succinate dehydrogenase/fumarate reductase flavoprotein subunit
MGVDELAVDVLVIGAGMAGLTVGAVLAQSGTTVVVLDSAQEIGGSARLSEGYVWTAPSVEVFQEQDPGGDTAKFETMLSALPEAFAWLESINVSVGPTLTGVLGYGSGRQIDVVAQLRRCRQLIERKGSVLVGCETEELITENGRVVGAFVRQPDQGDLGRVRAMHTVIATGGFQASPALRDEWLFPGASEVVLRANPISGGGGIRLALAVGADLTPATPGFYGHLVPSPLTGFAPPDFARLAQYHSEHGLLVGADGRRFTDESLGDHVNAEVVAQCKKALLIVDERIKREQVLRPFIPGMDVVDKMAEAGMRGARYVSGPDLESLADVVAGWGYDGAELLRTVRDYNASIESGVPTMPARRSHHRPLDESPFAALEVQAAITFTYRGLATDADGRVLRDDTPIEGLWAVGVDAGGLNTWGYTGGLVRGLVLGRHAAKVIISDSR